EGDRPGVGGRGPRADRRPLRVADQARPPREGHGDAAAGSWGRARSDRFRPLRIARCLVLPPPRGVLTSENLAGDPRGEVGLRKDVRPKTHTTRLPSRFPVIDGPLPPNDGGAGYPLGEL